ncbi:uncharacterized protein AMSG_11977 [Thecamonas trahens ATCC 50062]|uniref:Uncharacterized protein n=1 Tax=Thecamonas trahens ATCC 50062 TaxID=461836 RepID=A0A0L0DDQ6_THETB|nr:hypothetical protein AMSG_11977 [Thecamonas trahens ATCC 50062]KNC50261.1 hypothetical protein AMSG_11977 [Thecamonas trahens ATCC 50062]|eukprot:XP_013757134.1 hypothetical protein AMSG_11977 [Thecamonas trahens ATCC 50062]
MAEYRGWLLKKGKKMMQGYRKRYFVLADNILNYYEDESCTEHLGMVDMVKVVDLVSTSKAGERKQTFSLVDGEGRTYLLAAETEKGKLQWMQALMASRQKRRAGGARGKTSRSSQAILSARSSVGRVTQLVGDSDDAAASSSDVSASALGNPSGVCDVTIIGYLGPLCEPTKEFANYIIAPDLSVVDQIITIGSLLGVENVDSDAFALRVREGDYYLDRHVLFAEQYNTFRHAYPAVTLELWEAPEPRARNLVRNVLDKYTPGDMTHKRMLFYLKSWLADSSFAEELIALKVIDSLCNIISTHSDEANAVKYALEGLRSAVSYISGMRYLTSSEDLMVQLYSLVANVQVASRAMEVLIAIVEYDVDGFRLIHLAALAAAAAANRAPYAELVTHLRGADFDAKINALGLINVLFANCNDPEQYSEFSDMTLDVGVLALLREQEDYTNPAFCAQLETYENHTAMPVFPTKVRLETELELVVASNKELGMQNEQLKLQVEELSLGENDRIKQLEAYIQRLQTIVKSEAKAEAVAEAEAKAQAAFDAQRAQMDADIQKAQARVAQLEADLAAANKQVADAEAAAAAATAAAAEAAAAAAVAPPSSTDDTKRSASGPSASGSTVAAAAAGAVAGAAVGAAASSSDGATSPAAGPDGPSTASAIRPRGPQFRKPAVTPKDKMKPLFWNRILAPLDADGPMSIWHTMEEADIDVNKLAKTFADTAKTKKLGGSSGAASAESAPKTISTLSRKRFTAVSVMLASLPDVKPLTAAIISMSDEVLKLEQVQQLRMHAATDEELMAMRAAASAASEGGPSLDAADTTLLALADAVPHLSKRLQVWEFLREFDEAMSDILHPMRLVKEALDALTTSTKLQVFLSAVLAAGNYLNGGNKRRGQADGFGLDILAKLSATKGEGGMSLLLFLTYWCMDQLPDFDQIYNELAGVIDVSHAGLDLQYLQGELRLLSNRLKSAVAGVSAPKMVKAQQAMAQAESSFQLTLVAFSDAMTYFGIPAKKQGKMRQSYNAEESRRAKDERRRNRLNINAAVLAKGKGKRIAKGADPMGAIANAAKNKRTKGKNGFGPSRNFGTIRKNSGIRLVEPERRRAVLQRRETVLLVVLGLVAVGVLAWLGGVGDAVLQESATDEPTPEWRHVAAAIEAPRLVVDSAQPPRLNILVMGFDFNSFYGGMIGISQFALRAARLGLAVRWVNLGDAPSVPDMAAALQSFPGLEELTSTIEFGFHADRSTPLLASPADVFVATQFLSAHVAAALHASPLLASPHFVYFIQDIESTFFAHGTMHALADASYAFDHRALFSYGFLRDYFAAMSLGVFAPDTAPATGKYVAYQFPVKPAGTPTAMQLKRTPGTKRKLLFYARPEAHAQRNMFELGMMALSAVIASGDFNVDEWEFHGIGSKTARPHCGLPRGACLTILPRTAPDAYLELLASYDVGLSLMLSPHPSIPPFDFAAAGLVTVTNTYTAKSRASLLAISSNLIPVQPTIGGVADGLREALARVDNVDARLAGCSLSLASEWSDDAALGPRTLAHMLAWLPPRLAATVPGPRLVVLVAGSGLHGLTDILGILQASPYHTWRVVALLDSAVLTGTAEAAAAMAASADEARLTLLQIAQPGCTAWRKAVSEATSAAHVFPPSSKPPTASAVVTRAKATALDALRAWIRAGGKGKEGAAHSGLLLGPFDKTDNCSGSGAGSTGETATTPSAARYEAWLTS